MVVYWIAYIIGLYSIPSCTFKAYIIIVSYVFWPAVVSLGLYRPQLNAK